MGAMTDQSEALSRLAQRYVSDGLSFWDALNEAARIDPGSGVEAFTSSVIYQLERALGSARAESRTLRAEIQELERRLDPSAAEAFEREMDSRLAREREADGHRP